MVHHHLLVEMVVFKVLCHFINIVKQRLWSESCPTHMILIKP